MDMTGVIRKANPCHAQGSYAISAGGSLYSIDGRKINQEHGEDNNNGIIEIHAGDRVAPGTYVLRTLASSNAVIIGDLQ